MVATSGTKVVTFSFAIENKQADPQSVIQQASEFVQKETPQGWRLISQTVRDSSYSSEMLQHALTGSN